MMGGGGGGAVNIGTPLILYFSYADQAWSSGSQPRIKGEGTMLLT